MEIIIAILVLSVAGKLVLPQKISTFLASFYNVWFMFLHKIFYRSLQTKAFRAFDSYFVSSNLYILTTIFWTHPFSFYPNHSSPFRKCMNFQVIGEKPRKTAYHITEIIIIQLGLISTQIHLQVHPILTLHSKLEINTNSEAGE